VRSHLLQIGSTDGLIMLRYWYIACVVAVAAAAAAADDDDEDDVAVAG